MSNSPRRRAGTELVPLAHRMRHMQLFRVGAVAVTLLLVVADAGAGRVPARLLLGSSAYLVLFTGAGWAWRRLSAHKLSVFGALLLVDGVYLAWVGSQTGATASPARYVILLHLIAVALLASHRTSLKIATWHSLLALLVFHARDIGVLGQPAGGQLDERSLQIFILVCWLVTLVTASFSAVNERELRRRRYDLEALATFAADLEVTADPKDVAGALLAHLAGSFGFRRSVLVGARSGPPEVIAHHGCAFHAATGVGTGPGSLVARTRRTRTTLLAAGIDPDADRWLEELMPGARHLVVVPLPCKEPQSAVLICEHDLETGSRIAQRVVLMVERFAAHTALALENSWLLDEVTRAASTDGLTGIRNRRAFDEVFAKALARSAVNGEPVSLLLLDIDHFKVLNDTLGHQTGDDVLREVGAGLRNGCRPLDMAARYGGEEFAVVLPGCTAEDARELGDRIRRAAVAAVTSTPITASAGVSTYPVHGTTPETLLAAADEALYAAKRAGRDRLVVATPQRRGPAPSLLERPA